MVGIGRGGEELTEASIDEGEKNCVLLGMEALLRLY